MIPKVIHYCWFGDKKPQRLMQRCIKSWQKTMPDFTIKCWGNDSFDFDSIPFTQEALSKKKYAFVSDYVRLYALYTEGGIYLDTDVEVYKNFSPLLDNSFFCGTEAFFVDNKPQYRMEATIMGATPFHPFIGECLSYYKQRHFINNEGEHNEEVIQSVISKIGAAKFGYQYINQKQQLQEDMIVYPTSYFTNDLIPDTTDTTNLYAKHCNAATWIDYKDRGKFFHFCRRHDLMALYHFVEKLRR